MQFTSFVESNIKKLLKNKSLKKFSTDWVIETAKQNYSYNFSWLGRPAIQYPSDMIAMQEIVWTQKPDLVIDIGVAHGGSVIYMASLMALLDLMDANTEEGPYIAVTPKRMVLGVDIEIRDHNKLAIEKHRLSNWVKLVQGSSIASDTAKRVFEEANRFQNVLICLDSNHTHEHVLRELEIYTPLIKRGGYCCVFDTIIEDMPKEMFNDRAWGPGDNPKTAVWEFLRKNTDFEIDKSIEYKIQTTVAPDGFLKRIN